MLVKYNKETLEVEGFFTEEQREENANYIEIEDDKEIELIKLNQNGTLFVKNIETKEFIRVSENKRRCCLMGIFIAEYFKMKLYDKQDLDLFVSVGMLTEEEKQSILGA